MRIDYDCSHQILLQVRVSALMDQPGMEYSLQPWTLRDTNTAGTATVLMSASLRYILSSNKTQSHVLQLIFNIYRI